MKKRDEKTLRPTLADEALRAVAGGNQTQVFPPGQQPQKGTPGWFPPGQKPGN